MLWLEKMDAVLLALYDNSGNNPSFKLLKEWLYQKHGESIDEGEMRDILLYFHREGIIYCELHGDRDYKYVDNVDAHYLLNCKGKLFWENSGGYVKQKEAKDLNEKALIDKEQRMERNDGLLVTWTQKLAERTADLTFWTRLVAIGAVGLVAWEIVAFFWGNSSNH